MNERYILAIDQGTSSSRAIIYDRDFAEIVSASREIPLNVTREGWVEHSPWEILQSVQEVIDEVVQAIADPKLIHGIGIANQRETFVVWNRASGEPVYPAIVWQDTRSAEICQQLSTNESTNIELNSRSGLLLDPYFSGTKLTWLLDSKPEIRASAEAGELAFGTVDSWLLWNLCNEQVHITDVTNAARTLLFNLETKTWDPWLCDLLRVPRELLPEIHSGTDIYGCIALGDAEHLVPVLSVLGDQQAALLGNGGNRAGVNAITYGSGAFFMSSTGEHRLQSEVGLLTTIGMVTPEETCYVSEGSIFSAGIALRWLRDNLKCFASYEDIEGMLEGFEPGGVYAIPAFTGLGAPHWDPLARTAFYGLTLHSDQRDMVYAMLEAVCMQTNELLESMRNDGLEPKGALRAGGGMARNTVFLQMLADIIQFPVERLESEESTAQGVAFMCAMVLGWCESEEIYERAVCDVRIEPQCQPSWANTRREQWLRCVAQTLTDKA